MPTGKPSHKKNFRIWNTTYSWLADHLYLSAFAADILYLQVSHFAGTHDIAELTYYVDVGSEE